MGIFSGIFGGLFSKKGSRKKKRRRTLAAVQVERFESRSVAGHFLSLSVWRDEAAIRAWREASAHRAGQIRGRNGIFARYHIRVAQVVRDYDFAAETKAA